MPDLLTEVDFLKMADRCEDRGLVDEANAFRAVVRAFFTFINGADDDDLAAAERQLRDVRGNGQVQA